MNINTNAVTVETKTVKSLPIIFWQDTPVITTELLASVYETDVKNIQMNFSRNIDHFIDGQHCFKLTGTDLKEFKNQPTNCGLVEIAKNTSHLMLWTERGTVRHAKMLGTEKAWEVQDQLAAQLILQTWLNNHTNKDYRC